MHFSAIARLAAVASFVALTACGSAVSAGGVSTPTAPTRAAATAAATPAPTATPMPTVAPTPLPTPTPMAAPTRPPTPRPTAAPTPCTIPQHGGGDGDADNLQAVRTVLFLRTDEFGHFFAAGCAPGGPEIDYQHLASPLRQRLRLAACVG